MDELERVNGVKGLKESTQSVWKELAPKIISERDCCVQRCVCTVCMF